MMMVLTIAGVDAVRYATPAVISSANVIHRYTFRMSAGKASESWMLSEALLLLFMSAVIYLILFI